MGRKPLAGIPRVLVVDDQEDIRTLLVTALEIEGYEVIGARDARDGLRCLGDLVFSLVVSDYAMPGGTGMWMLRAADRRGLLAGTPAIIVTAHPDLHDSEFQILRKPLDLDRFLQQVGQLVRRPIDGQSGGADGGVDGEAIELVLYVSSSSFASNQARRNLARALQPYDPSRIHLTVRDLYLEPFAGAEDGISMTPTLVKRRPGAHVWVVGSLHDPEVLADLLESGGLETRI